MSRRSQWLKVKEAFGNVEKCDENKTIVYKKLNYNAIAEMRKVDDENNESRQVVNPLFSKYRGRRFYVIRIWNIFENKWEKDQVKTFVMDWYCCRRTAVYQAGCIVEAHAFDPNPNVVCASGIHYFRSLLAAFLYDKENEIFQQDGVLHTHITTEFMYDILGEEEDTNLLSYSSVFRM